MEKYRVVSSERTHLFKDMHFLFAGEEYCKAGYRFGPAVRPNYIIHYIISGTGYYEFNGQVYKLSANQSFVIFPDKSSVYWADEADPWHYIWIGFTGVSSDEAIQQMGISVTFPIINFKKHNRCQEIVLKVLDNQTTSISAHFLFQSVLFDFLNEILLSRLSISKPQTAPEYSRYIHESLQYIENNYNHPFTISEMAEALFVNRSYLSRIFHQELGITLKEYINNFRITRARELLVITDYAYSEIAHQIGYESYNSFYKAFRQITGETPSTYRSKQK